ncbi:MAG: hypothetical protein QNJ31_08820 [Candidatus Caenarcaniphilales bacterium]|nr:hypothetical protein [Candidatus Caenarcaniphilales bacterium]
MSPGKLNNLRENPSLFPITMKVPIKQKQTPIKKSNLPIVQ